MHKVLYFSILFSFLACEKKIKKKELPFDSKANYNEVMILSHQEFLKKEKEKIQNYIDSVGLIFEKTGTGLRYHIIMESDGDSIKTGEIAIITYSLFSLNGDLLYESPKRKLQEFMVDYDNVESGLHEGIQKLKVGEEAILILPAHLGHGITGDQAAIPSQTTLIYKLKFIGKK